MEQLAKGGKKKEKEIISYVFDSFAGKHIGDEILSFIKGWFIDPLNKTGCRYIIVDASNHQKVIDFYQRNGFKFIFEILQMK
ncbi:hypothetical protein NXW37_29000 [Bacteroides thetaiotaomicron]|nr:hypothetical protein [Bacteroides thetaiotaomicron]